MIKYVEKPVVKYVEKPVVKEVVKWVEKEVVKYVNRDIIRIKEPPLTPSTYCSEKEGGKCRLGEGVCHDERDCHEGLECGKANCGLFPNNTDHEAACCYDPFITGFGPHNVLDRNTFRGRALADVLIEETTNSAEKIEVYCCSEEAGDISDKRFCGQGVSCLTVCGEDEDGKAEVDLIDVTFDKREDSEGISFCNSRIVFKDPNLLDEAVCPNPIVQKSSAYTYVHQDHYYKHPGPAPEPTETFIKATSSSDGSTVVSRQKRQARGGRPKRFANIKADHCFGRERSFRNLLDRPPTNEECCLSNKIAQRPKALDVCCDKFTSGVEEGGYLSRCPTVRRGNRRQKTRNEIFRNNRRGKREL